MLLRSVSVFVEVDDELSEPSRESPRLARPSGAFSFAGPAFDGGREVARISEARLEAISIATAADLLSAPDMWTLLRRL
jgi:hypothetical protein